MMKTSFIMLTLAAYFLATRSAEAGEDKLEQRITKAVDRGVAYLKEIENQGIGNDLGVAFKSGVKALVAWTLLESGVPANDPDVTRIAELLRTLDFDHCFTYSLSTAIIFFDRLGDPADSLLIQYLATRLLENQCRSGGWGYGNGIQGNPEPAMLKLYYELITKNRGDTKAKEIQTKLQQLLSARIAELNRTPLNLFPDSGTDNSNTQFAALGLWVARRHGVPVDRALQFAELRFRSTQEANGAWKYSDAEPHSTLSMVCAGLIVIALGRGTNPQVDLPKSLAADPHIQKAFIAVAGFMKAGLHRLHADDLRGGTPKATTFYGLWSLERTGMIYNLNKIYGEDWYKWGASYLVDTQEPSGNWRGPYENLYAADTCFALLFLRRANPAKDLATKLKNPKQKLNLFAPIENAPTEKKKSGSSSRRALSDRTLLLGNGPLIDTFRPRTFSSNVSTLRRTQSSRSIS